jgi:hypothetical protein
LGVLSGTEIIEGVAEGIGDCLGIASMGEDGEDMM